MKRHWKGALYIGVVIGCLSICGAGRGWAAERPGPKGMQVKVVHGETGAPVAGVRLNVSSRGGSGENVEALTDDRGECRLDVPDATREFYIFYRKENFVEGIAAFGGSNKLALPE